MLANLGCSQSHLGQQPVSICMCVPVSSSIWVNGLQYVRAPVTTGVGNVQRIDRSNDNVIASLSETIEDLQNNPFGAILFLFA